MMGQNDAEQTATRIRGGIPQTRGDFPINMLALPSARTNQNDSNRSVCNMPLSDFLTNGFYGSVAVVYIAIAYRAVYDVVAHHLDEAIRILLIFMVVAYEYLVAIRFGHSTAPW